MNNTFTIKLLLSSIICMISTQLIGQISYKINSSEAVSIKMSGTSTVHNWIMNSKTMTGDAQFGFTGSTLKSIPALSFVLPVKNLKSKEKAMDNNAYKALKSKTHKDIIYTMTSAVVEPGTTDSYTVKTVGDIVIAGVTKSISMDMDCRINQDKTITFKGSKKIKMSDFNVKPPTFLLGAMKTGDEINLDFNLVFIK